MKEFNAALPKPAPGREEPEAEAWRAEDETAGGLDPLVSLKAGGETFHLRRSWLPATAKHIASETRTWLREQKDILDAQEYLALLCSIEEWLNGDC